MSPTKPPIDRPALLRRAADLINRVVADLDLREEVCGSCNMSRKANLNDYRASTELLAAINKLERWGDRFAGAEDDPGQQ